MRACILASFLFSLAFSIEPCVTNVSIGESSHLFQTDSLTDFENDVQSFCSKHEIEETECKKLKDFHQNRCFSQPVQIRDVSESLSSSASREKVGPILEVYLEHDRHLLQCFVGETPLLTTTRFCKEFKLNSTNCNLVLETFQRLYVQSGLIKTEDLSQTSPEIPDAAVDPEKSTSLLSSSFPVNDGAQISSPDSYHNPIPPTGNDVQIEELKHTVVSSFTHEIPEEYSPPIEHAKRNEFDAVDHETESHDLSSHSNNGDDEIEKKKKKKKKKEEEEEEEKDHQGSLIRSALDYFQYLFSRLLFL
jgi:hypothetical protein